MLRQKSRNDRLGFTIAELLITLGIIGVVAVLLLPRAFDYIEEQQFDAARKVILKNVGEAVRLVSLNSDIRSANDAEDFVENYLRKELKILKTCKNEKLRECGIETNENKIFTLNEARVTMPRVINDLAPNISKGTYIDPSEKSYGFVMVNGYSVNLFYNNNCTGNDVNASTMYFQDRMCINAIYDINGLGAPNQMGKDIGFVTIFYPGIEMRAVAPNFYKTMYYGSFLSAPSTCAKLGKGFHVPERDELGAMYYNYYLLDIEGSTYMSSTAASNNNVWVLNSSVGAIVQRPSSTIALRCVK